MGSEQGCQAVRRSTIRTELLRGGALRDLLRRIAGTRPFAVLVMERDGQIQRSQLHIEK